MGPLLPCWHQALFPHTYFLVPYELGYHCDKVAAIVMLHEALDRIINKLTCRLILTEANTKNDTFQKQSAHRVLWITELGCLIKHLTHGVDCIGCLHSALEFVDLQTHHSIKSCSNCMCCSYAFFVCLFKENISKYIDLPFKISCWETDFVIHKVRARVWQSPFVSVILTFSACLSVSHQWIVILLSINVRNNALHGPEMPTSLL